MPTAPREPPTLRLARWVGWDGAPAPAEGSPATPAAEPSAPTPAAGAPATSAEPGAAGSATSTLERGGDPALARLEGFLATASDWLWETDALHRFTFISGDQGRPGTLGWLGRTRWQVAGGDPDHDPLWRQHVADLEAGRPFRDLLYAYVDAAGRTCWLEVGGVPFQAPGGGGYRGTSRDVTLRILQAQRLAASEARLEDILATASDWLWEMDERFVLTAVSDGARASGFDPDRVVGRTRWARAGVADPAAHPDWRHHLADLEAGRPFRDFVYGVTLADGSPAWIEAAGRPVRAADGQVQGYRGTARDVTRRVLAERRLAASEARLEGFLTTASDWLWETDALHRVSWLSPGAAAAGLDPAAMLGKTRWELSGVDDPTGDPAWQGHLEDLAAWRPFRDLVRRGRRADGSPIHIAISGAPVLDAAGQLAGYRGTARDVTAQLLQAEELATSQARLEVFQATASDWHWASDAAGRLTELTAPQVPGTVFAERLGKTRWELAGADPATDPAWRAHQDDILAGRPIQRFTYAMREPDGRTVWREVSGIPVRDAALVVTGHRGISRDVTAEVEARAAQALQTAQLRLASEIAGLGAWLADYAAQTLHWSDELLALMGREPGTPAPPLAERWNLVHPDDRPAVAAEIQAAMAGRRDYEVRCRMIRPDGAVRSVLTRGRCRPGPADRPPTYFGIIQDITEQVAVERALAQQLEANEIFRQIVAAIPEDLVAKDRESRFTFANPARARGFGVADPALLVGRSDADFFPAEAAAGFRAEDLAVLGSGRPLFIERRITQPDGCTVDFATTKSPLRNAGGEIVGVLSVNRDITNRVAMERQLAATSQENALFRQVLESLPDPVWISDTEGRYLFVNPTAGRELFLDGRAPAPKTSDAAVVPPEILARKRAQDQETLAAGAPRLFEVELASQDGGPARWLSLLKVPLTDAAGRATALVGHARDITELRRARAAAESAAAENALFRTVLESLPDPVWITTTDGVFRFVNSSAATLGRWYDSPAALGGRHQDDILPPEVLVRKRQQDAAVVAGGRALSFEIEVPAPDGATLWLSIVKTPLHDAAGRVATIVSHARDFTRLKRAEEAAVAAAAENALYRAIIEALPDFVFAKDREGRFLAANRATAELMGAASPADLLGRDDTHFYDPGLAQRYRQDELTFLDAGRTVILEQPVRRPDGSPGIQCALKAPLRDAQGAVIGYVGHGRDITEQKLVEAEAERLRGELVQAHDLLHDAIGVLDGGFAIFDAQGRLALCNHGFARSYGRAPADLAGLTLAELLDLPGLVAKVDHEGLSHAAFKERRLARHRQADGRPFEARIGDQAFYLREIRTRDGGTVVARTDITPLKRAEAELRRLATQDPLTGIANRRHFMDQAIRLWGRHRVAGRPLSVVLADIDHFKQVNDRFGHAVGDRVLKALAELGTAESRAGDVFARWGGEEFILLLPGAPPEVAAQVAERLRRSLVRIPLATEAGSWKVTASFGVAGLEPSDGDLDALVRRADQALYAAKAQGRDRVVCAQPSPPAPRTLPLLRPPR